MKRTLLLKLTATVCAFTCAFGFAACNSGDEHTHDYASEWKTSATHHWHECKNDGCDAKEKDKAEHADANSDGKCDACQFAMGSGDETVAVESITLNKSTLTLNVGGEETLTVTYAPANATDKTVSWTSSAPTIASVDDAGKVTAKAAGKATVTVTTANGKTATCTVTVNTPSPIGAVTQNEWSDNFNSIINCSINEYNTQWENENGETEEVLVYTFGYDNDLMAIENHAANGGKAVYAKDNNAYYVYAKESSDPCFVKSKIDEAEYNNQFKPLQSIKAFADYFSLFTYIDGVYNASNIENLPALGTITNIAVTFENGKLTGLEFEGDGLKCELKDVGTTTITLPTDYTEDGSTSELSPAGKTFVFSDMTCDGMDAETLAQTKVRNEGMTITFTENGTVKITQLTGSIIQTGTYTQNNETVTITITSMTMNGNPIDVGEGVAVHCTYDGNVLVTESQIGADTVAYSTFVLQTSESLQGTYNMVVQSSTGWVPAQDFAIVFNNDGTCTMEAAGTYVIENNVITLTFGADTYYAVIDGNILWMFENKADTTDITKSIQHFYNGTEISDSDRAKMVSVFGEGIINSKPDEA